MNRIFLRTLLALLGLAWGCPALAQQAGKEQLTVTLSNPGKPGTLHLKLVGGSIHVEGSNGKDVVIEATQRSSTREERGTPPPPGMRRLTQVAGFDVTAQEKDNHVYVKAQTHQHPMDFVIRVPRQFSLQLATVNHGSITVQNVTGELELSNVNGSIKLEDVSGSAVANTVNGDITASFREVNSAAPMAFSNINGRIDLSLPAKTKAALKLKSDRGEIFTDFDMDVDSSTPKVVRSVQEGTYRLNQDRWTYGKINGGGPEYMLKTLNGNIYVRKTK